MHDKLMYWALGKSDQEMKKKGFLRLDWVPLPVTNMHLKTL